MMRKLAFPVRWLNMEYMFGMRFSALCDVYWEVVKSPIEKQRHLLTTFRQSLVHDPAAKCARAAKEVGLPLSNCFGFIDYTKVQMYRPEGSGRDQRACYSGHKRFHCLVYQTITTSDGLISNMYGPEVGRQHDLTLYRKSGLNRALQEALLIDGIQYCMYGDAAHMLKAWLQLRFRSERSTMKETSLMRQWALFGQLWSNYVKT